MSAQQYQVKAPLVDVTPAKRVVIAVDGPAASGKGTLARAIAKRLGYAYLDTGALYRAVALATLEIGGDPSLPADVMPAVSIVQRNLTPELLESRALRTQAVSEAASKVAALPEVRLALIDYQRAFAANPPGNVGGVVLDGRDIGTVICPEADFKFYVTATAEERARRRFQELRPADAGVTQDSVLADIRKRDQRDSTRSVAPAVAARDAYTIDTTALDPAGVLDEAVAVIRSTFLSDSGGDTSVFY